MVAWIGRQYHRARKSRCPHDIALPTDSAPTFAEVETPYRIGCDPRTDTALQENRPIVRFNHRSERFIGLFGRTVEAENMKCHQCLWVWDGQLFPIHAMDYAPAMLYTGLGEGVSRFVTYDRFHYRPAWFEIRTDGYVRFLHNPLWNSFLYPSVAQVRDNEDKPQLKPLTDVLLRRWWGDDGALRNWYERNDDKTPFLKIRRNMKNPMRQLVPSFSGFALEGPERTSTLERASMQIRHIFAVAAMTSRSMIECIKAMQDLIRPAIAIDPVFAKEAVAGFASYVVLLHAHGAIEIQGNEASWNRLFGLVDEYEPKHMRTVLDTVTKGSSQKKILESDIAETESDYYRLVRGAIEDDRGYGVLRDEVAAWWERKKQKISKDYRESLYERIRRAPEFARESIEP